MAFIYLEANMDNTSTHGIQDVRQAVIKATNPMVIYGQKYEPGDTILYFNSIQTVAFQEVLNVADSRGGFDNRSHVHWETTREINGVIEVGVVSQLTMGIMNKALLKKSFIPKVIDQIEETSANSMGQVELRHEPLDSTAIKVYQVIEGTVIRKKLDYTISGTTLQLEITNTDILVDYQFQYMGLSQIVDIGHKDLDGYLKFVGKFYYTNEYDGVEKTAIIEIPRLRIDSNFQISVGRNTNPLISTLRFTALPINDRENNVTMRITYLDEDIDGDF